MVPEAEAHALRIGKLISNLLGLEFCLRAFFANLPGATPVGLHGVSIYSYPVGSYVPESELTAFTHLSNLVHRFNAMQLENGGQQIDPSIVEVRNALAHGLLSASMEGETMHLIKFDKPKNGLVRVARNEAMTPEWFDERISAVVSALLLVHGMVPT